MTLVTPSALSNEITALETAHTAQAFTAELKRHIHFNSKRSIKGKSKKV